MSLSTEFSLERWAASADRAAKKVEAEPAPSNARERFISSVLSLANEPGHYLDPTVNPDEQYVIEIRKGQHRLTSEWTLQASIFFIDGVPPDETPDTTTPVERLGDSLVQLDDLVDLKKDDEDTYPIGYRLRVVETATLNEEAPTLIHDLYLDSDGDYVGMDFDDGLDWDISLNNSTQEEIDAMLTYFMIRYWVKEIVDELPESLSGAQRLIPPSVQELVDVQIESTQPKLF